MKGIFQFNWHNHGQWLVDSIPYIRTSDACGFVALDKGQPIGAVIFDNFLYSCAQCTLVINSPTAIRLGLLDCAANFLFNTMGKKRVYALVAEDNTLSLRLCKRVGFEKHYAIPEGAGPGKDLIVLCAERDQLSFRTRKHMRAENG